MPACGDRYAKLLKTGNGLTPDDPFTTLFGEKLGNPYDYQQWKNLAELLVGRAHDSLTKLGEIETALGKGYPRWNEVVPDYERAREGLVALPNVMFTAPNTGVPLAIKVCQDAVCALELADNAIEGYGHRPKGGGAGTGDDWGWAWGLGAVALIGVGVYFAEKKGGG